jgi:hypothetical protein
MIIRERKGFTLYVDPVAIKAATSKLRKAASKTYILDEELTNELTYWDRVYEKVGAEATMADYVIGDLAYSIEERGKYLVLGGAGTIPVVCYWDKRKRIYVSTFDCLCISKTLN